MDGVNADETQGVERADAERSAAQKGLSLPPISPAAAKVGARCAAEWSAADGMTKAGRRNPAGCDPAAYAHIADRAHALGRLTVDLTEHPESSTLERLAIRDPETGATQAPDPDAAQRTQSLWDGLDARMAARGIVPPHGYHPDDDCPPEPRDRAIIDREFFPASPTVAAVADAPALTPEPPSWWDDLDAHVESAGIEAVRPSGPDPFVAACARLGRDLTEHPASPTLDAMATRDRRTGAVVGMGYRMTPLELAYTSGAPAELIVEAERQIAFIGERGTPGYLRRAIRMAHRVRKLNRLLHHYSGLRRTLGTVTVLWPLTSPVRRLDALRLTLATAEADADRATHSTAGADAPPGTGYRPPPLDSANTAPLLRTGPPSARVRVAS